MHRIKHLNDVLVGIFLICVACLDLYLSWKLKTGTSAEMGPGYVPKMLAFLLIGFGIALVVTGTLFEGEPLKTWFPRPVFWVLLSISFFALTVERFGLLSTVVGVVLLSCVANRGTKPLEAGLLAIGLAAFAVLTFVIGLGLPLPVWPTV